MLNTMVFVCRHGRKKNALSKIISLAEYVQVAIMDASGLEIMTNLLETQELPCKLGALKVLSKITLHSGVRRAITNMGGVELTIMTLDEPRYRF